MNPDPNYDVCQCGHFRWCHQLEATPGNVCMGYADECPCKEFKEWEVTDLPRVGEDKDP